MKFVAKRSGKLLLAFTALSALAVPAPSTAKATKAEPSVDMINHALKNSPLDPRLNFLAALSYEKSSVVGTDRREMARVGYAMALKGDPAFWPAHMQLGLMAMEDRDATAAQQHFLDAALLQPEEPTIFYALARAAFCAGDLPVARAAWDRATALQAPKSPEDFTTGAAVMRRAGLLDASQGYVAKLQDIGAPVPSMIRLAADAPAVSTAPKPPAPQQEGNGTSKMGMVDVIILRRDDGTMRSTGINLLDALTLQFGSTLVNSSWNSSRDRVSDTLTSSTLDVARDLTVSVPSVNYSLNVANAQGGQSTIQAQQALLIYDGQTSKFHIGSSLTFATDGSMNSSVSTKDDGLVIEVGAHFADQDMVRLDINASLEDFVPGSGPGSFRQSVQTEKTTTTVAATLHFGETILIASGEQSLNSRSFDRTPILGSLPLLGNLFNERNRTTGDTSVMVLLTLRPRGSHSLPQENEAERLHFEQLRERLLDQLGTGGEELNLRSFAPDKQIMSYRLDNPAKLHDAAYLKRAGVLSIPGLQ
jgi:hypothetical protein